MRSFWYPLGYQKLRITRILHANSALAGPYGFCDAPWIKEASGVWLRRSQPHAGPTSAPECQQLVPSPGSCGTRTVTDAVFRPVSCGETPCTPLLLPSRHAGMLLPAGRTGRHVPASLMPGRRPRISPRVVKRALSRYNARGKTNRPWG